MPASNQSIKSTDVTEVNNRDRFLLIDGHAVIYRSFYSFPKHLTDPKGRMMNAVYGFSRIVLSAIRDFDPVFMAVTFDHKGKTKRAEFYEDYKANRPPMPEELRPQIEVIKEIVEALNIPQYCMKGYEADDLIGTISLKIEEVATLLTIIISGDQDLFQLVDGNTHVWLPGRGSKSQDKEYDAQGVKEKIGLPPKKIVDMKALMGDSSDNIPGIRGIGPKTAVKLLRNFSNLDEVFKAVDYIVSDEGELEPEQAKKAQKILKGALLKKLKNHKEAAYISQKLALIDQDAPLEFNLEDCRVSAYDKRKVIEIFDELNFQSLITLLPDDEFEQEVQQCLFE